MVVCYSAEKCKFWLMLKCTTLFWKTNDKILADLILSGLWVYLFLIWFLDLQPGYLIHQPVFQYEIEKRPWQPNLIMGECISFHVQREKVQMTYVSNTMPSLPSAHTSKIQTSVVSWLGFCVENLEVEQLNVLFTVLSLPAGMLQGFLH